MRVFTMRALIGTVLAAMVVNPVAHAGDADEGDSWKVQGAIYLWGAGIEGTTTEGDKIDVSFDDLVEDLEMGYMGTMEARKGRWGLLLDVIYLDVEGEDSATANLVRRSFEVDLKLGLKAWIVTAGASYSLFESDTSEMYLMGGARYLYMDADLDFRLGPFSEKYSDSGHVLDGIVGLRGRSELNTNWYLNYHVDAGAGDSDLVWNVLVGLNYRFEKADLTFGYRHMAWEFDDNDTFEDLDISGPYLGMRVHF